LVGCSIQNTLSAKGFLRKQNNDTNRQLEQG